MFGFAFRSADKGYSNRPGIPLETAGTRAGKQVRFQSFHTSISWKSAMYFSVMMSFSVIAPPAHAGTPWEARSAL